MRFAKRERQEAVLGRRIAVELLVVAGVGLALAALGPFGSYAIPFGPRALYWMASMLAGYAFISPLVQVSRSTRQFELDAKPAHRPSSLVSI